MYYLFTKVTHRDTIYTTLKVLVVHFEVGFSAMQRPYYKTSNLEIRTQKVWFGAVSDCSLAGFLASHWLKVRAKPNLLGTNFKI